MIQLLRPLRRINLFKVIAVEGDVDFDLLGLLLAFEVRVDGRKPKAVLESLVKATVQLHTDFETYLDRLGPASRSCPPS